MTYAYRYKMSVSVIARYVYLCNYIDLWKWMRGSNGIVTAPGKYHLGSFEKMLLLQSSQFSQNTK